MIKQILGVCEGRHAMPVAGYIFPKVVDPTDLKELEKHIAVVLADALSLDLYVTGLTVCVTSVINYCIVNHIQLTLYHYNSETHTYYQQTIHTTHNMDIIIESGKRGFWK